MNFKYNNGDYLWDIQCPKKRFYIHIVLDKVHQHKAMVSPDKSDLRKNSLVEHNKFDYHCTLRPKKQF